MCSTAFATPTIQTTRLKLRSPTWADAARVAEMCCDFAIPRMSTRMPWPYRLEDAQSFVEAVENQDHERENTFLIEQDDEGVVGCIGLFMPGLVPEIGYWIGRPYWGRGYATEACKGALRWAKETWRKKVVVAGHFADNAASGAVLCKSGFLYTGEIEMRHSMARGEDTPTRMMVWLA